MGFLEYARLLRRHWFLVVFAAVLGAAAGLLISFVQTPSYRASTEVFISTQAAIPARISCRAMPSRSRA